MISMMGSTSHKYDLLHRPTRVRKMHSSRRDAFRTLSDVPVGRIDFLTKKITYFQQPKKRANCEDFWLDAKIDPKVAILYFYPGMQPDAMEALIDKDYHGFVVVGTGLGHVSEEMYSALERAKQEDIPVVIVVQPLFGFTQLRVYETGREMLARGAIEGANMLPEAAYVKLIYVLGHTRNLSEVKDLMQTPIAGEITTREPKYGYLLFQGSEKNLDKVLQSI